MLLGTDNGCGDPPAIRERVGGEARVAQVPSETQRTRAERQSDTKEERERDKDRETHTRMHRT